MQINKNDLRSEKISMRISLRFIKSIFTSFVWWLGVAIAVALYIASSRWVAEKAATEFDYHTNNAQLTIQTRIQSYIDGLHGARALFSTSDHLTREQFHSYVDELNLLQNFPGINNLNFAQRVLAQQKDTFESAVQQDSSLDPQGYPDFIIKPSGTREEYHVLTYLEPMRGNEKVFGFDIASRPAVAHALDVARDSGEISSSGKPIPINVDNERHIGLAMRLPLYRRHLPISTVSERRAAYFGSIGVGFDLNKLLADAIDKTTLRMVRIKFFDGGDVHEAGESETADPTRLLFDTGIKNRPSSSWFSAGSGRPLIRQVPIVIGSRVLQAEFSTYEAAMLNKVDRYIPWYVLASSIITTLLLYGVYYFLMSARRRAIEIAKDMTRGLRISEANLAEAQHMARLGSWILDLETHRVTWSAQAATIFGLDERESDVSFKRFLRQIHETDRERVKKGLEKTVYSGDEFNSEHRIVLKDGSIRWVQTISRLGTSPHKKLLRGTMMDITERKEIVEALQRSRALLRELTLHQEHIKEEERKRIAREIHDELGQTLLALRIDVSMLEARTAHAHPKLNARVNGALTYLDATVKTVRTIINNLRPAVLDLGLVASIEWQLTEFRRRTGITFEFILDDKDLAVADACATTLFRILQESLTNVAKHAEASHIIIELQKQQENLLMRITDNGKGMPPHTQRKRQSFGLVGMEERVLALNGKLIINSAAGEGVSLLIIIPLLSPTSEGYVVPPEPSDETAVSIHLNAG